MIQDNNFKDMEEFRPREITKMLNSTDPAIQQQGYYFFRRHSHWLPEYSIENLKKVVCRDFNLSSDSIFASFEEIEPARIFASQDSLEQDKIPMVQLFFEYVKKNPDDLGGKLPPPIVWKFFDEPEMNYIVHDGHHRIYFAYKNHQKIKCAIIEPMGNVERIKKMLHFAFNLNKRVINLPIQESRE